MALIKKGDKILGITTDSYSKIRGVKIDEYGEDANGKLYSMDVSVDKMVSQTNKAVYSNSSFRFDSLREVDLALPNAYALLLTTPEYS